VAEALRKTTNNGAESRRANAQVFSDFMVLLREKADWSTIVGLYFPLITLQNWQMNVRG
jgi:hypothetical protein